MALDSGTVAVTNTAAVAFKGTGVGVDLYLGIPDADVIVGDSGVTTTTGIIIDSTATVPFHIHLAPGDELFVITATTATLPYLKTGG